MGCKRTRFSIQSAFLQTIGLQWNMLHGLIPDSWRNLRAETVWLRPGNYQLCGSKPLNATFELCKEVDGKCELLCLPNACRPCIANVQPLRAPACEASLKTASSHLCV